MGAFPVSRHPIHLLVEQKPLKMACGLIPRRMPFCTTTESVATCPYCLEAIREKPRTEKEREVDFFFR